MLPVSIRKPITPIRTLVGVALLVLASLFSTIKITKPMDRFVYKFAGITAVVPDDVTLDEQRFARLRPLLPRHGTVGYVTDGDPQSLAVNEKYLAVQYALAPVLVKNSPRQTLVVGNIMLPTTEDRKSTRLNSSHIQKSRMPSSA